MADGRLSTNERDAAFCYGVATERYGGYFFMCKDKPNCPYEDKLKASDAFRKPAQAYLERQGLMRSGDRSDADKLEMSKVMGRGGADYRGCMDYFTRTMESCFMHCLSSKQQGACLKSCQTDGDAQACARIEACGDDPTGIKP